MRRRPLSLDLGVSLDFLLETLGKQDALLSRLLPLLIQAFKHFWNFCEVIFRAFKFSRFVQALHFTIDVTSDLFKIIVPSVTDTLNGVDVVAVLQLLQSEFKPTPVNKISQNHDEET